MPHDPAILKVEAQRLRKRWVKRYIEQMEAYDEYMRRRKLEAEAGVDLGKIEQQLADAMARNRPVALEATP